MTARLLFVSSLTYRSCAVMIGVMFVFMIMLMDRIEYNCVPVGEVICCHHLGRDLII